MTSPDRWSNYLNQSISRYNSLLEFAVEHWNYNHSLYRQIKRVIQPPARILEVGSGLGFSALYLQSCGYRVLALDNNPRALDLARQNAGWLDPSLQIEFGDAADLRKCHGQFDLVFSAGVLEHFDREATVTLLIEQAKCARYVMAIIPTRNTKYAGRVTDERFYSPTQLRALFNEAGLVNLRSWGFGDTPSLGGRLAEVLLPPLVYQLLLNYLGLGMNIGCTGQSPAIQERIPQRG